MKKIKHALIYISILFSTSSVAQEVCDPCFFFDIANRTSLENFDLFFDGFATNNFMLSVSTSLSNPKSFAKKTGLQHAKVQVYKMLGKYEQEFYCEVDVPQNVVKVNDQYVFSEPPPTAYSSDPQKCEIKSLTYGERLSEAIVSIK